MRPIALALTVSSLVSPFATTRSASAAGHAGTPQAREIRIAPRGGAEGMTVRLDTDALRVRSCTSEPCDIASDSLRIAFNFGNRTARLAEATLAIVKVDSKRSVVHVRVPTDSQAGSMEVAWEAIVAPGKEPLFSGLTGLVRGDEGERTGDVVSIVPNDGGDTGASFVILGSVREEVRICGQKSTAFDTRALDPKTMTFRGAAVQRLSAEQLEKARDVAGTIAAGANATAREPLAPLIAAAGQSSEADPANALIDRNRETAWRELRGGDGRGEFATFRSQGDVPIARLSFSLSTSAHVTWPNHFYLVTERETMRVTLPKGAKRGQRVDVPFEAPLVASCLSIVLDGDPEDASAKPEIGFAEMTALSSFDVRGASFDDVARALDTADSAAAAAILKLAVPGSLGALEATFTKLGPRGQKLALDVVSGKEACAEGLSVLVRGAASSDAALADRAIRRIERCGRAAAKPLLRILESDKSAQGKLAPLVALLAPEESFAPLLELVTHADASERSVLRSALARAARSARIETLASALRAATRDEDRLDRLRAFEERLGEIAPDAIAIAIPLASAASGPNAWETRYLLTRSLGKLALANTNGALAEPNDAAMKILSTWLTDDAEWPVRAAAADALAGVSHLPNVAPLLARATADRAPRVREAALRALRGSKEEATFRAAQERLRNDSWTFVNLAAIDLLRSAPNTSKTSDAIGAFVFALDHGAPRVRVAAAEALGAAGTVGANGAVTNDAIDALLKHLKGGDETLDGHVAIATALGHLCAAGAVETLGMWVDRASAPTASEAEARLGLAAIGALGDVGPADLVARLGPALGQGAEPGLKNAATRALKGPHRCAARAAREK